MEEVPILNVRLHQKYLPKRVVSGRRCQLLVRVKLSRCFEIICNWQTHSSKTNKYMSSRRCNWLFKVTDNRYIIFHFGGQVKRLQKPHSLQSVSPSLVLTIHTFHSLFATCLNVPLLLYFKSTWELLFFFGYKPASCWVWYILQFYMEK